MVTAEGNLRDISTHPNSPRQRTARHLRQLHHGQQDRLHPACPRRHSPKPSSKRCWGGKKGTLWEHDEQLTKAIYAGSDHTAIYADLKLG